MLAAAPAQQAELVLVEEERVAMMIKVNAVTVHIGILFGRNFNINYLQITFVYGCYTLYLSINLTKIV